MGCYIPREKAEEDDEDNLEEDEGGDVDGHAPGVPRLQHLTHLAQTSAQTHIDPFWELWWFDLTPGLMRSLVQRARQVTAYWSVPAIPLLWLSSSYWFLKKTLVLVEFHGHIGTCFLQILLINLKYTIIM